MANDRHSAPKYRAGEAYYLSHKTGAPARIFIDAVYMKALSKEWMYCIRSEANRNAVTYVSESVLSHRISKHDASIYKNDIVSKRYDDGYRFAGNFKMDDAINRGKEFAKNENIVSVLLHPALDYNGKIIDDEYGIWIKWSYTILSTTINKSSSIKIK